MKYNILFISLFLSGVSYSNDFAVIVDPENAEYISEPAHNDSVSYSDWVVESNNCSFDITEDDVYFNIDKTQNESCLKIETRVKTVTRTYLDGTSKVISTNEEERSNTTTTTTQITGTHIESDCKNVLIFDNSLPSGEYTVNYTGSNQISTCDMTTDGGGWTLVDDVIQNSFTILPNIKTLNSNGLSYNDVYFKDTGTYVSYKAPYDKNLDYEGFQEAISRVKSNGSWVLYTSLDYSIIKESNYCYYLDGAQNYRCATDLVIRNVSNIQGLSDIETVNVYSHTDNSSKYNFEFYVR